MKSDQLKLLSLKVEFPINSIRVCLSALLVLCSLVLHRGNLFAAPVALHSALQIQFVFDPGGGVIRLVASPHDGELYYLNLAGDVYRVALSETEGESVGEFLFSSSDFGLIPTAGLAIGPDGAFYVVSNMTTDDLGIPDLGGAYNVASIGKAMLKEDGTVEWSILAETEPYPLSQTYDHLFNAIAVSPDGQSVYVNSGSRTDHGELHLGDREVPLTASLFCLPANAEGLVLLNDRDQLISEGYLFAEGLRNTFDLAFDSKGRLIGTENGPDRDMPEELNWLRKGLHYGFPWKMGGEDNPQQFPDYNPDNDLLLNPLYGAVNRGFYYNDPSFPPAPVDSFIDPVFNDGPDADRFRDPRTGKVIDASKSRKALNTFTAHRSPLGIAFDTASAFGGRFRGDGYMLSFQRGDANGTQGFGPFLDASEDLIHVEFRKLKRRRTNLRAKMKRIVTGFNRPVDAAIVSNHLYVLEYSRSGSQAVWRISFPSKKRKKNSRKN